MKGELGCCGFSRQQVLRIIGGLVLVVVLVPLGMAVYRWMNPLPPADPVFIQKLQRAHRVKPEGNIRDLTLKHWENGEIIKAGITFLGMDKRGNYPWGSADRQALFQNLGYLGGYGEILWVDD